MEQEKNNKGVIALLVIIIVILLTLVILLATGTISFKSNNTSNDVLDGNTTNNDIVEQNTDTNSYQNVRYYQYYVVLDNNSEHPTYSSREIELNTDGSAKWRFGGNGQGGDNYKGTYTEDSNKIVLTLERDMPNNTTCDDNNTVFPCSTTLTLSKNSDNTISSTNELGNDGLSYVYKFVDKTELHHFN